MLSFLALVSKELSDRVGLKKSLPQEDTRDDGGHLFPLPMLNDMFWFTPRDSAAEQGGIKRIPILVEAFSLGLNATLSLEYLAGTSSKLGLERGGDHMECAFLPALVGLML